MIDAAADHAGMLALFAASLLGGFVLGLRFRVLVLLPVIVTCILIIAIASLTFRTGVWPAAIAIVVNAVGLQIGYLIGVCAASVLKRRAENASARLSDPAIVPLDHAMSRRPAGRPPSISGKP